MYNLVEQKTIVEDDTEIKVVPIDDIKIIQISSGTIRGMLAIQNDVDKSELMELVSMICDFMEQDNFGTSDPKERAQ